MKTLFFVLAGLPLAAAPLAAGTPVNVFSATPSAGGGLVRVDAQADDFDRDAWRARLGGRDLAAREHAFEELVELARRDDAARAALKDWSTADGDAELAWTSRLALRELERATRKGPAAKSRVRAQTAPDWSGLREQMSDLQRRFGGMDSMFESLQREFDELMQGGGANSVLPPGGASSRAQSFTLRSGPDGVEVRVQENVDGKVEEKTYTAKTLDELYAAHPELQGRVQLRMHDGSNGWFGPRAGARAPFSQLDTSPFDGTPFDGPAQPLLVNPEGPRLGVMAAPVDEDEAHALGIEAGHGLKVARVLPGTFAEQLGIQEGDVLVALDETPIHSRDDVAKVLKERKDGAELRATVVDEKGHERKLTLTNPSAPKASTTPAPSAQPVPQTRDSSRRS